MFQEISYYLIGGIPFVVYLGIVVFVLLFLTGLIAILKKKGKTKISIQWHVRLAYCTIILGAVHLSLGIFSYI
jgi:DMSO/TMAO reductase YedYZ heme-binding membrane subunit